MEYTKKKLAERDALATQIMSMAEAAATEDRSLTESENASIDSMKASMAELDTELRRFKGYQDAVTSFTELDTAATVKREKAATDAAPTEWRSVGDLWTKSEQYADYGQRLRGNSEVLKVPFDSLEQRAIILTSTVAGGIQKQRIAPSSAPTAATPLSDLVGTVPVTSNAVEWVFFPAAAPLGTVTAEGAQKTEAALTISVQTVTLDTIASWAKYTRQFAADGPALAAFIDEALSRGINDKIEALIAAELTSNVTIPVTTNTSGTLLQGIRRAIGTVQAAGFGPQAVVLNPQDYASLDLDVLVRTLNGPQINANFWGVTPVAVGAVPSGTAFVGDFSTGMKWLQRQDVTVYTTDSDISGAGATAASDFRANVLTTLAEGRGKAIVHRPEALAKVTGTVTAALDEAAPSAAKK